MKKKLKTVSLILLSLCFVCVVIVFGVPLAYSLVPPNPTQAAMYTQVAQMVNLQLTANAQELSAQLTQINADATSNSLPTPSINSQNWLENWVKSPTCQPPCWENIIPGKTAFDKAIWIVSKIPDVKIEGMKMTSVPDGYAGYVSWKFDQLNSGSIITNDQNSTVESVELYLDEKQNLLLEDIINVYGNPSAVIRTVCEGGESLRCYVGLIYEKIGLLVNTNVEMNITNTKPVTIRPKTRIISITFFPPSKLEQSVPYEQGAPKIIWRGYGDYVVP
jgi:hypothetical protein